MKITEIYFRSTQKKSGQQWFEIFNDSPNSVNLRQAQVKLLEGQKKQLALKFKLPEQDVELGPGQYAVIAQEADLGQNLCSDHRVIVAKEIKFASQGVQTICIQVVNEEESCAKISDSKSAMKDVSRNLLDAYWAPEECVLKPGILASPGLPKLFCQEGVESGWTECPAPLVSTDLNRPFASGCRITLQDSNTGSELLILLFLFGMLLKRV